MAEITSKNLSPLIIDKRLYQILSRSCKALRSVFRTVWSFWKLTSILAAVLLKCLSNFKAILSLGHPHLQHLVLQRSHGNTVQLLKWMKAVNQTICWWWESISLTICKSIFKFNSHGKVSSYAVVFWPTDCNTILAHTMTATSFWQSIQCGIVL